MGLFAGAGGYAADSAGAPPLLYQWRKDDIDLIDDDRVQGANTATLTLDFATPYDAGAYSVHVENPLGAVTSSLAFLSVGFESDLGPGPYGDNRVETDDLELLARVIAGLEELAEPWQFARADSAPRETLGDGVLSLADWVQAGRYSEGLDPLTPTGGPLTALAPADRSGTWTSLDDLDAPVVPSVIRLSGGPLVRGQEALLTVEVLGGGEENALAFTLEFDADLLEYREATLTEAMAFATLLLNTTELNEGRLAVVFGLPPGITLPADGLPLLHLRFDVVWEPNISSVQFRFGDEPVQRDVVTVNATMQPAEFEPVTLPVNDLSVMVVRFVSDPNFPSAGWVIEGNTGEVYSIESSSDLIEWENLLTITNETGTVEFVDPVPPTSGQRYYRARIIGR